jgi:hypothetical protein
MRVETAEQKWRGDPEHADAYIIRMYTQDWCDIETPSLSSFRRPVPTRRHLIHQDSIHNMVIIKRNPLYRMCKFIPPPVCLSTS